MARYRYGNNDLDEYFMPFLFSLIIAVIILLFFGGLGFVTVNSNDSDNAQTAKFINNMSADQRQSFAKSALKLKADSISVNNVTLYAKELKKLAKTGSQFEAKDSTFLGRRVGWTTFWKIYLPLMVACSWLTAVIIALSRYKYEENAYLLDLDWRDGWSYLFIFLNLPVAWPFLIASFFFVRHVKEVARQEEREREGQDYTVEDRADDDGVYHYRQHFVSQPNAARQAWLKMRQTGWSDYCRQEIKNLSAQAKNLDRSIENHGKEIRSMQAERNECLAHLKQLEPAAASKAPLDATALEHEFDKLLSFEGVRGIRVINDNISIQVSVLVPYQGKTYDFGDWELRFGPNYTNDVYSRLLRCASLSGRYPNYSFDNEEGSGFCFGGRLQEIKDHQLKGQFLEAAELAIACLHSVNEGDWENISRAFKAVEVTDDEQTNTSD